MMVTPQLLVLAKSTKKKLNAIKFVNFKQACTFLCGTVLFHLLFRGSGVVWAVKRAQGRGWCLPLFLHSFT
jgi:hypothetical protein